MSHNKNRDRNVPQGDRDVPIILNVQQTPPPQAPSNEMIRQEFAPIGSRISDLVERANVMGEDLDLRLDIGDKTVRVNLKQPKGGRKRRITLESEG
jgi:hypothetical protein